MLSQNQKSLEKQLQCLGISIAAKTESAPIQAYRVHLISRMENVKMLTGYEDWGKQDNAQPSRKQAQKSSIQVGKGLKDYLFATFINQIETLIHKEVYNSALEEIQLLFSQRIQKIINDLTFEEKRFYQRVASFYEIHKDFTYLLDKSKVQTQTIQSLLRLDLFSFILQQNEQLQNSFQNYKIKELFSKSLVMRILELRENQYDHFKLMFDQMHQFICFAHMNQFRDIIAIFCFVELKRKISTYYHTNGKQKKIIKDTCELIALTNAGSRQIKNLVQFRFCQFVLIRAFFWPITKTDVVLQSKIITGLISVTKNNRTRNEELLGLKIKLNSNLRQISRIYQSLQDHQTIECLKNQSLWIANIFQWKCLAQNRQATQITDILEKDKFKNYWMISNYFLYKIQTRYAIKRFELTATIAESIKKIMRSFSGHEEVFIHYFIYSFKGKQDKNPKVFVSLILATKGNDIFFEAIFPFKLTQHQFAEYILQFFARLYQKTKKSYEINIFSFSYGYIFLEQPLFKLINSMKKMANSYVFPLNSKLYFKKHFIVNKIIQLRLYLLQPMINCDNLYNVVKKILLDMKKVRIGFRQDDKDDNIWSLRRQ